MQQFGFFFFCFFCLCSMMSSVCLGIAPVVFMHGMAATNRTMTRPIEWVKNDFPGTYVTAVYTGSRWESLFADLNLLVDQFAEIVRKDANLQNGFNAVGHSQGGLITRAYIERYGHKAGYPKVLSLISWMGVQNGVFGVPDLNDFCPITEPLCRVLDSFLDDFLNYPNTTYGLQAVVTFAAFWKDVLHYSDYLKYNTFLADINNERPVKNPQYKQNLIQIKNYALIYGTLDKVVIPNVSPIFDFFAPGNVSQIIPMHQSDQYIGDWIGLKTLDQSSRLHRFKVPCGHTQAPSESCKPYIWPITKQFFV